MSNSWPIRVSSSSRAEFNHRRPCKETGTFHNNYIFCGCIEASLRPQKIPIRTRKPSKAKLRVFDNTGHLLLIKPNIIPNDLISFIPFHNARKRSKLPEVFTLFRVFHIFETLIWGTGHARLRPAFCFFET